MFRETSAAILSLLHADTHGDYVQPAFETAWRIESGRGRARQPGAWFEPLAQEVGGVARLVRDVGLAENIAQLALIAALNASTISATTCFD